MKHLLTVFFCLHFIIPFYAQETKMTFGVITPSEIALKKWDKEPDAVAIILAEVSTNKIQYEQILEVHRRIKILKKDGYSYATIELPYYIGGGAEEKVKDIKGCTYNMENGVLVAAKLEKKISLTKSSILTIAR